VPCQGCGLAYFNRAMQERADRRQEGRAVEPYDAWHARIRPLEQKLSAVASSAGRHVRRGGQSQGDDMAQSANWKPKRAARTLWA
jgi:hypothetical protein